MNYYKNIGSELYLLEQTYKEASLKIKSSPMKTFLKTQAETRKKFRNQLKIDTPSKVKNGLPGNIQTVLGSDTQVILIQCLTEEENLIKEYQKALSTDKLDKGNYQMVSQQLFNALVVYNQLRAMKLSFSYS